MKKIIAVILSINLLVLNASPVLAQVAPRKLAQGTKALATAKLPKVKLPAGVKAPAVRTDLGALVEKAALQGMHLPLTQNYGALLKNSNPLLPAARQILAHNNAKERTLLLHSDFVVLALDKKASVHDMKAAADFYRDNLQKFSPEKDIAATVADIASLGILGNLKDADLIFNVARQAADTAAEIPVTSVAARALLRLKAYDKLAELSRKSGVQADLWNGIREYAKANHLPLQVWDILRVDMDVKPFQESMAAYGTLNQVAVDPSQETTYLYMNAGRDETLAQPADKKTPQNKKAAEPLAEEKETQQAPQAEQFVVAPTQNAALEMADKVAAEMAASAPVVKQEITPMQAAVQALDNQGTANPTVAPLNQAALLEQP